MTSPGRGESAVAAAVAAQTEEQQQAARFTAKSPTKSLRHDIEYNEVTQAGIDAAARAGASPRLLSKARAKLAGAASGDDDATSAAEKNAATQLDLTDDAADADETEAAARKKKTPAAAAGWSFMKQVTKTQAIVNGKDRERKEKADARKRADDEAKTTEKTKKRTADEAAKTDEAKEDRDSPPDAKKLRRTPGTISVSTQSKMVKNASTVMSWAKRHEWMSWDGDFTHGMKCATCLTEGKTGDAFTTEDGCTNFMVKNLQQHEETHHKSPVPEVSPENAASASRSLLEASAREAGSIAQATLHGQRLAYMEMAYVVSHTMTTSDTHLKPILDAFDRAAARLGAGLASGATEEKRHCHAAADATQVFSERLKGSQLKDILTSPVVAIACDESQDVSVKEIIVLYIYYIKDGDVRAEFFEFKKLVGSTAVDIKNAIIDALRTRAPGLEKKLIVLDSDGCSVMFGSEGGVGALLRAAEDDVGADGLVAYLLQLHCCGHKLQLAVGEGLNTPETRVIDRVLSASYGLFSNSGQRREGLEKIFDELKEIVDDMSDSGFKQIKRHISVRWLSRAASIDSLIDALDALIVFLHEHKKKKSKKRETDDDDDEEGGEVEIAESGRMSVDELIAAYSDFETVAMLHYLGDLCEQLAVTSVTLQGSVLDVQVVLSNIDGLIGSLESDFPATGTIKWGPRMRKFLRRCPSIGSAEPGSIDIANGKHSISVSACARDRFYQAARDAAELTVEALKERMPDSPIVSALLKIFDARSLPEILPADYGDVEVETVLRHFAPHAMAEEAAAAAAAEPSNAKLTEEAETTRRKASKIKAPDYVDADKFRSQFSRFKFGLLKTKRGSDYRTMYRLLSQMPDYGGLGELWKVGSVLVLIALSNAISERGFSMMNNIKTKKKARLDQGLDPKARTVALGPNDHDAITKLVDAATVDMFGSASPNKAKGARASHEVRRAKKQKAAASATSAADVIAGANNGAVSGDGTSSQTVASQSQPFPSGVYETAVAMPALDASLVNKKVLYLYGDAKGSLAWQTFNVTAAKRPKRAGAYGDELTAPKYKFTLTIGKKGESITTKLPAKQYGTDKKWLLAVKKKK